jgi:hypothetical protein
MCRNYETYNVYAEDTCLLGTASFAFSARFYQPDGIREQVAHPAALLQCCMKLAYGLQFKNSQNALCTLPSLGNVNPSTVDSTLLPSACHLALLRRYSAPVMLALRLT